jgi:hypothetical protein
MYAIKGFITHAQLANNNPGQNAYMGELSTQSLTYSREKGYYVSPAAPDLGLTTFLAARDGTKVRVSTPIANHVLAVAKHVYDKTLQTAQEVFADEVVMELIQQFQTTADSFTCGAIVTDGTYYIPQWVSWKMKASVDIGSDLVENQVKIWFTDASFKFQYDEFEIVVVPPIDNLNEFFRTGAEVESLLTARSISEITARMQQAKNDHPETVWRIEQYDYVDPLNALHRVPSTWGLLIYGIAGNNIDSIKDALVNYILANSTHTRNEWMKILPDIFRRTEFILVPMWDSYAIPNRTLQAGIYSPVASLAQSAQILKQMIAAYPASQIDRYATVMGHPYKSLSILAVGGPENRDSMFKITDFFSDYIAVSSTSQDFNRMSVNTKTWMENLSKMLLTTETMTDFSDIPLGMSKTIRNGILYLVYSYNNVHYLVAAKKNFPLPVLN